MRGAYAALLYATAAELVSHGRYAVTDASLVALVAWSLACAALFLRSGKLLWAIGTTLFAALAVSFKVTALTALAIPVGALIVRSCTVPWFRGPAVSRLMCIASAPLVAVTFFCLNPHVLLHWDTAINDLMVRTRQTVEGGFPLFVLRKPGLHHLSAVLVGLSLRAFHRWPVASILAASCGVTGLVLAWRRRSQLCVVAAVHAMLAICSIAFTSKAYLFRNYIVALPALCIGFGFTMQELHAFFSRSRRRTVFAPVSLVTAFALVYIAVPLEQAIRTQRLVDDARIRAIAWIARCRNGKPANVAATPELFTGMDGSSEQKRDVLKRPGVNLLPDLVENAEQAKTSHADYILITSGLDANGDHGEWWPFETVPGYRLAGRFEANPFEHTFEMTPTWSGRYDAIVLERAPEQTAPF